MKTLQQLCVASLLVATNLFAIEQTVEQWGIHEIVLKGPTNGNPFLNVRFAAKFSQGYASIEVPGFYDGDGKFRVRFSPEKQGNWKYETASSAPELNGKTGEFAATKPAAGNHGPVRVANTFHFAYADGTPTREGKMEAIIGIALMLIVWGIVLSGSIYFNKNVQ